MLSESVPVMLLLPATNNLTALIAPMPPSGRVPVKSFLSIPKIAIALNSRMPPSGSAPLKLFAGMRKALCLAPCGIMLVKLRS
eukprot:6464233-Amphidinium_carterae.1